MVPLRSVVGLTTFCPLYGFQIPRRIVVCVAVLNLAGLSVDIIVDYAEDVYVPIVLPRYVSIVGTSSILLML